MKRVQIAAVLLALFATGFGTGAAAQTYPQRPIRLVVSNAPGGFIDLLSRALAERLALSLKQPVVIENRAGANDVLAAVNVARSAPDGYTLFVAGDGPMSANPQLYSKLPYDPKKDFTPVAMLVFASAVFVVSAESPAHTLKEFVDYAKANPDKLNYYSVGYGSPPYVNMEMFKRRAGINMVHVPFNGGAPGVLALLQGQVQAGLISVPSPLPHLQAGKVRGLALGGSKRLPILPDVPTFDEAGFPGFRAQAWQGIVAPAGTPPEIVSRLNTEINLVLNDPEFREKRIFGMGLEPMPMSIQQFADFLPVNLEDIRKMVQTVGAKLD